MASPDGDSSGSGVLSPCAQGFILSARSGVEMPAEPCRFPANSTCGGVELRSAAGWEALDDALEAWELTDSLDFNWEETCQTQDYIRSMQEIAARLVHI